MSEDSLTPSGAWPSADTVLNEESNVIDSEKPCVISCVELVLDTCGNNKHFLMDHLHMVKVFYFCSLGCNMSLIYLQNMDIIDILTYFIYVYVILWNLAGEIHSYVYIYLTRIDGIHIIVLTWFLDILVTHVKHLKISPGYFNKNTLTFSRLVDSSLKLVGECLYLLNLVLS